MNILMGMLTVIFMVGIGYLLSENKKAIKWDVIIKGIIAQAVLMFIVLKTSIGQAVLNGISNISLKVLNFATEGINFVFGGTTDNFVFAINVLGALCFTGALISVLYYLKVIPFAVKIVGGIIGKILGTTPVESFCCVGNAFLGGTEAPLLTKRYLKDLTKSELFAVILGGFASVSVSVVLGYVTMGLDMKFILVQMAIVPFSALLMAKLMIPETEETRTADIKIEGSEHDNIFSAIGGGAIEGMTVALNVGAVLIGFIAMVGLLNWILSFIGLDLTKILSVVLYPIGWLLNIPSHEIGTFTSAVGIKTAVNEYVAISGVGGMMADLSMRTQAMLTMAIVNFANFSVIGITIGGFSAFCPEKVPTVSKLGLKAMVGALLTTLISTALIGMFY